MEAVDYKCPSCNAYIHFKPKLQGWECEYCGSKFQLDDLEKNKEKFERAPVRKEKEEKQEKEFSIAMDVYNCPNCGASVITDTNTSATFCVYCKNTTIIKDRLTGAYAPSYVIPFHKVKADAIKAFETVCKGKILMPKEFSDAKNIQEITGIYIPFWLFDCTTSGNIEVKATKVSSWYLGDYMHTKTDTYNVKRGGEFKFIKIPVDGSIKFDDAIMNSIEPYNYNDLKEFSHSYLSGFLSEKYDVDKNTAKNSAESRSSETLYDRLDKEVQGYTTKVITNKQASTLMDEANYVLLPVWMLNIKYQDKFYTFAMNGQTGKMIGNIPYSKKKAAIGFIIIFVISLITLMIITYLV